jgi:pantoate--beta-alanine ligase
VSGLTVVTIAAQMSDIVAAWKSEGHSVAFVPTMGSLHDGHGALIQKASELADRVVLSIFVNPLQFGTGEDFDSYPRDHEADQAFLHDRSVDVLFVPSVDEVYPRGGETTVVAGGVGDTFEGASRPGHFDGVLTVVKRLFAIVSPDFALFGRKDAQQLFLVESMVRNDGVPITIVPIDTVRAPDGLALSSRNAYLSDDERTRARAIPVALAEAEAAPTLRGALSVVRQRLESEAGLTIDYVSAVDPETFRELDASAPAREATLILAARIGNTRLIDNRRLRFPQ